MVTILVRVRGRVAESFIAGERKVLGYINTIGIAWSETVAPGKGGRLPEGRDAIFRFHALAPGLHFIEKVVEGGMGFVVLWQGGIKKGDEVPDGTLGRLAPVP